MSEFSLDNMLLTVNATSRVAWCCWWVCRKITKKVSSATIVLRKYQASQMPSSRATCGLRGSRPLMQTKVMCHTVEFTKADPRSGTEKKL